MKKLGILLLVSIGLSACQTPLKPSKYQPEAKNEGFSQSNADKYLVSRFKGNSVTSKDLALLYANFRAQEICKEQQKPLVISLGTMDYSTTTDMMRSSGSSYQMPTQMFGSVTSYGASGAVVQSLTSGGSSFSSSSSWMEKVSSPTFEHYFLCGEKSKTLGLKIKDVSSEQIKHLVPDMLGAVQALDDVGEKGARIGDFILRVNGKRVITAPDFMLAVQSSLSSDISLSIIREGKSKEIKMTAMDNTQKVKDNQESLIKEACGVPELKKREICGGTLKQVHSSVNSVATSKETFPASYTAPVVYPSRSVDNPSDLKFGVGIGYNLVSNLIGTAKLTGASGGFAMDTSGPVDEKYSGGIVLSAHVRNLPEFGLGFIASAEYHLPKSAEGQTVQSFVPKASLGFRGGPIYGFLGGNLSFHGFDVDGRPAPGYSTRYEADGGLGYQIGSGVYLNENFALELEYESVKMDINLKSKHTSGTENSLTTDSYVQSVRLGLKILF